MDKKKYDYRNVYPDLKDMNELGEKGYRFVEFFRMKEGGTLFVLMEKELK